VGFDAGLKPPAAALLGLPSLPQDAHLAGPIRQVLSVNSYDGADRFTNSVGGVSVNQNNGWWLELDATTANPYAWAMWRLAADAVEPFTTFRINCGTPSMRYYVIYADYARNRWMFYTPQVGLGLSFAGTIEIDPASLPGGESVLHSPGGFAYIALIAVPANSGKLQVKGIDVTIPGGDPLPGEDPIYDQFENNDTLATCTPLTQGMFKASIHQRYTLGMQLDGEERDYFDCYCVNVPVGKTLTATLRHETFDHFGGVENDADLLFYFPGASNIGNDFDETLSSTGIFYDPFEQVNFVAPADGDYLLTVIGDNSEPGVRTNAEYDLGIFISDAVYDVSGTITQGGNPLTTDVVAFLKPGNFNVNTPVPPAGVGGSFTIKGVPPGTYTLWVHGTARYGPTGYVYPEHKQDIEVLNANVTGIELEIGPNP